MFPFYVLTAGMALAGIFAFMRMREPESIEE
jgi:hypothetical protein